MAAYSYICPACGETLTVRAPISEGPPEEVACPAHDNRDTYIAMKRDYQADNVGLGNVSELRKTREGEGSEHLFLPSNKDFESPKDPDGTTGMRKWRENHAPRPSNKRPAWPGSVERKVY
jgi:hypothetical protein